MAMTVNTNTASIAVQRNLNKSSDALSTAMSRLSSGLRINSAKDDAAGLQISSRLTTQIRGMNVAINNAGNAISIVQTAEGALQESSQLLQRMRELALQAKNENNSQSERDALNAEFLEARAELSRISQSTTFGSNLKVLDGSAGFMTFHIGANTGADQEISINLDKAFSAEELFAAREDFDEVAANGLSLGAVAVKAGDYMPPAIDGTGRYNTLASAVTKDMVKEDKAARARVEVAQNLSTAASEASFKAAQWAKDSESAKVKAAALQTSTAAAQTAAEAANQAATDARKVAEDAKTAADTALAANAGDADLQAKAGEAAAAFTSADKAATAAAEVVTIAQAEAAAAATAATQAEAAATTAADAVAPAKVAAADARQALEAEKANAQPTIKALSDAQALDKKNDAFNKVARRSNIDEVIRAVDSALDTINATRAELGAKQNRLSSTISNLHNMVKNAEASRGQIQDVDFAAETAELTKQQTLQQASTAVLAQANQLPAAVLKLLQ